MEPLTAISTALSIIKATGLSEWLKERFFDGMGTKVAGSRVFTFLTAGAVLQMNITGNRFANAKLRLDVALFGAGKNALVYTGNVEDAITIDARPVTGAGVVVANNVVV